MRISQLVANFQQQWSSQAMAESTTGQPYGSRGLGVAQRINQARLTDAGNGFLQASKVRDGIATVSEAVGKARSLVEKASTTTLSAADRKQLQTDLTQALAAVDQGAKDQGAALADKTLTNKTYDAKSTTVVAANQLGQGVSQQFASVADLRKLDLNTATSDQLVEAGKVLDAARSEAKRQQAAADIQTGRSSGQVGKFQAVQDTLNGSSTSQSTRQQRDLATIQTLTRQNNTISPGSLFNTFG